MKKLALISAIALSGLFYSTANAQIRIGLHINTPAVRVVAEAPVYANYNNIDDYYYLPDVDAYYSVAEECYYYNDGARWISAAYLPGAYRNYDWRSARRYEVRANRPYFNADMYRARYRGNVGSWGRYNNYANRDFNRGGQRNNDLRFERRGDMNRGEQHFDNRGGYYGQPDRGQGYYRGENNYRQSNQPGRNQGWNSQPSRQNGNGRQQWGNDGGEQHFKDNHDRSGHDRSRF
ncbi:hypothetical protein [Mucilaginibacter sp.]|uniref:hypothetical protein n=1 Tax=Mucilaginibacter sp. TaxID=1882438 RepID=UPI002631E853|nr:hypothetical protein [Mucilaginibacter sp.]MDB5029681.1 hypothetical protein [Mucilaginibacter sp.]